MLITSILGDAGDSGMIVQFMPLIIIGCIVYYFAQRGRKRVAKETQERLSLVGAAATDFASLVEKGIQIRAFAGGAPTVDLREGEHMLCSASNSTLLEPRAVRAYRSSYGGPSIRVAKGVYFRFGQSRGTSESHDELRPLNTGSFILTSERLIFIGSLRTNSIALDKIVEIESFTDGLTVHCTGKEKNECYQFDQGLQLQYQIEGQKRTAPLDGSLIKGIIDEAVALQKKAGTESNLARAKRGNRAGKESIE